jgi:hypothetical protein
VDLTLPLSQDHLEEFELRIFKFAAQFYLTILGRSQNKGHVPAFLNLLKSYLNKSEACARWLITEFSNRQVIEEFFLQCSNKELRKLNVGLLYCAMLKAYQGEKIHLLTYWDDPANPANNKTVTGNLVLLLLHELFEVKRFVANCSQYF